MGVYNFLEIRPPHKCYQGKFCPSRSNGWCVVTEMLRKSLTHRIPSFRSLKVIWINTDRSATYDFLLVFNINYIGLSRSVSEVKDDSCKISHHRELRRRWDGLLWNFVMALGLEKLEWCLYQIFKKCDDIFIRLDNTGIGRTDGRTELLKHYRVLHA